MVGHWVLPGVVRRRAQSFRGRLCPNEWISTPQTQQIAPVKPLLPQSTLTLLPISSHSCCLIRDALRVQSARYRCPGHTSTLSVLFPKVAGAHAHENVDLQLYILPCPRFAVCRLSRYPRKRLPPLYTEKACTLRNLAFNRLS